MIATVTHKWTGLESLALASLAERDRYRPDLLSALPPITPFDTEEQRLALVLKVYLEFSYRQIREVTGWSVPKIETLISRAKARLKKNILLQESGGEPVVQARKK